jgi:hypothetical protein
MSSVRPWNWRCSPLWNEGLDLKSFPRPPPADPGERVIDATRRRAVSATRTTGLAKPWIARVFSRYGVFDKAQDLLRIHGRLATEAAAHIGRQHADTVVRHPAPATPAGSPMISSSLFMSPFSLLAPRRLICRIGGTLGHSQTERAASDQFRLRQPDNA